MKQMAEGVWRQTAGFPLRVNAYLVADGDGVAVFDAGIKPMGPKLREAAAERGGATRVVLGNAHADHRGGANGIGAPVQCHPTSAPTPRATAARTTSTSPRSRPHPAAHASDVRTWDDGPVEIAATVAEGDRVGEFEVVHLPGHGPAASASGASATASLSPTTASRCSTPTCPPGQGEGPPPRVQLVHRRRPRLDPKARGAAPRQVPARPLRAAGGRRRRQAGSRRHELAVR